MLRRIHRRNRPATAPHRLNELTSTTPGKGPDGSRATDPKSFLLPLENIDVESQAHSGNTPYVAHGHVYGAPACGML